MIIEVRPKFKSGDKVTEKDTGRNGTVLRVWTKAFCTNELSYRIDISYTVLPEKISYNQFRAKEKDLLSERDTIAF